MMSFVNDQTKFQTNFQSLFPVKHFWHILQEIIKSTLSGKEQVFFDGKLYQIKKFSHKSITFHRFSYTTGNGGKKRPK